MNSDPISFWKGINVNSTSQIFNMLSVLKLTALKIKDFLFYEPQKNDIPAISMPPLLNWILSDQKTETMLHWRYL